MTALSVIFVRHLHPTYFAWCHCLLVCALLVALLLHLWWIHPLTADLEIKIPATLSAILWPITLCYQWARTRRCEARVLREVFLPSNAPVPLKGAYLLQMTLKKSINIYPGAYFYVYLNNDGRGLSRRGIPLMVLGWDGSSPSWPRKGHSVTQLSFLVQDQPQFAPLAKHVQISASLEGPCGRDLQLDKFSTVCLVAKGMGIAATLPLALSLAERRFHDNEKKSLLKEELKREDHKGHGCSSQAKLHRDCTRRLNFFWVLENNYEIDWASKSLEDLMGMDLGTVRAHGTADFLLLTVRLSLTYGSTRAEAQARRVSRRD